MPDISVLEYSFVGVVGFVVGVINGMAGGASVLVYTAFMAIGLNPVAAVVTTAWGVTPANLIAQKASPGSLRDLYRANYRLLWLSISGTVIGAIALLQMPLAVLEKAVPVLLLIASLSVLLPMLRKQGGLGARQEELVIFGTGLYCGYFGPGQGLMVAATLAQNSERKPLDLNSLKNFITGYTALVSNFVFLASGQVHWILVSILAVTSGVGGYVGARSAGKLSITLYRLLLLSVGLGASVWFFIKFW